MSIAPTFPHKVRAFREKSGLTQNELGKMLGVSGNYVGMIEGGKPIEEESSIFKLFSIIEQQWSPRNGLRAAREASGLTVKEAAKKLGVDIGVLQAIELGTGKCSERLIEKICGLFPTLNVSELMSGSDHVTRVNEESGNHGMMGQKPNIDLPEGVTAKYVPLISWAQAGTMASFSDEAYQYEAHLAFNVTDRKAIAIKIRGDSMAPQYGEGDIVILYPSHEPRTGDLVIARLSPQLGEDVMFKIFSTTQAGRRVVLSSYNPAFPPLEYQREDFAWIYPAASVVKQLRK